MYPFKMKLNPLMLTVMATSMILFDCSPKTALALTGREIMDRVNERETGDRSTSEMEMILISLKTSPTPNSIGMKSSSSWAENPT